MVKGIGRIGFALCVLILLSPHGISQSGTWDDLPQLIFDQDQGIWLSWTDGAFTACETAPVISHPQFTGTGTRRLDERGRQAINELFERSFG